jgi:hypothetical protein
MAKENPIPCAGLEPGGDPLNAKKPRSCASIYAFSSRRAPSAWPKVVNRPP